MEFPRLAEVAEQLERPPQWLRRYILARQKATGARILVDVGARGRRPTYRVDVGALRRACPELFDARDPIAAAIGTWRHEIKAELEHLREDLDEVRELLGIATQAIRTLTVTVQARR